MTNLEFYYNDLWSRTLKAIYNSGQIENNVFELYIVGSTLHSFDDNGAIVLAPDFIHFTILTQHKQVIETCFEEQVGKFIPVKIIQENDLPKIQPPLINNNVFFKNIDHSYTFTNFVLGKSNMQAQVAAWTCANNIGIYYNPLFIYGNSGLGKTHLLNAIGNHVQATFPNRRVAFITGLDFVEGVAKSIKDHTIDDFKASFNDLDVLLVDDIQFIAGKDKTHEVFFTVFNNLVNNKKQVCITADRTPSEIKGLEERIISRFNQGLNVNVESPEYETCVNIIKMKIHNDTSITQSFDEDVISYIATNFSQDVRSLEGAINRILFYSINFSSEDHISLELAYEAFKDQIIENKSELSISKIRKIVCDYYNLTKQQICSASRTKNIATARHIAMYLCRKLLDASFDSIGNEFGKRDHSTVMSSCDKVEKLIKNDPAYLKAINDIESKIN